MGPYFIVGNSRSGTKMLGRVIGLHPRIFTFNELHFFEQLWNTKDLGRILGRKEAITLGCNLLDIQRNSYLNRGNPGKYIEEAKRIVQGAEGEIAAETLFKRYLEYETLMNDKEIACDPTPRNVFYIKEILFLFPEAKIINIVRDPRDVLLSQKNKWKRKYLGAAAIPLREAFRSWVNYHPVVISKLWNSSIRAAELFKEDARLLSVKFEDIVESPDRKIREICDYLGVTFEQSMLRVPRIGSSLGSDDPGGLGIDRRKVGNWNRGRLNRTEVYFCESITAAGMKRCGYISSNYKFNIFVFISYLLTLPIKLFLAFVLNIRRMRNIGQSIARRVI